VKIRTAIFGVYVASSALGFAVLMAFILSEVRPRYVEAMRRTMGDTAAFLAGFAAEGPAEDGAWIKRLAALPPNADLLRVFASDPAGRVVFADWLRGFGNLLIIDHGAHGDGGAALGLRLGQILDGDHALRPLGPQRGQVGGMEMADSRKEHGEENQAEFHGFRMYSETRRLRCTSKSVGSGLVS
jgi:hypothetical protein